MDRTAQPLRIAVADDERDMRQFIRELLPQLGHQVVALASTGKELAEQCQATQPDLVITDIKMPDMDGLQAAALVNQTRQLPVILITGHTDLDLLATVGAEYIMAFLTKPVKPADLQGAIALAVMRFEQFQKVRQEAVDLRQALQDRKLIERAKGALMPRLRLNEEEAFARLRKAASSRNHRLIEVAERILKAEEVFLALEQH